MIGQVDVARKAPEQAVCWLSSRYVIYQHEGVERAQHGNGLDVLGSIPGRGEKVLSSTLSKLALVLAQNSIK
jgi:hypothetical protein